MIRKTDLAITVEQKALLHSFTCERLSSSEEVLQSIEGFENQKGSLLVQYLKEKGYKEDQSGETAFYVIRNKDKLPLLFFSLKCGSLFSPFDVEAQEQKIHDREFLLEVLNAVRDETNEAQNCLYEQLNDVSVKSNQELPDVLKRLKAKLTEENGRAKEKTETYHLDEEAESENPIIRVDRTIPGIELMHFCANDNAREYWRSLNIDHPMGEVLFWWFIVPTILKVQQFVGCKYIYLFAADTTEDRSLVNYYNTALKFEKPTEKIGTNKPVYDYCCEFMVQEINQIVEHQRAYFLRFNLDPDEVIA